MTPQPPLNPAPPIPPIPSTSPIRKFRLWIEWVLLYALTPPLVAGLIQPELGDQVLQSIGINSITFQTGLPPWLFFFPILLATFLTMLIYLRKDPTFNNRALWDLKDLKSNLRPILTLFAITAPLIVLASWYLSYHTDLIDQSVFFSLPRDYPFFLLAIIVFYPWISAYPQEITHRAFFFHRYAPILGTGTPAFIINILAFSWLHIPMWNPIALIITLPAGFIFAYRYKKTNSVLATSFEHALYGLWAFTTGLGYFVFTGNAS